VLPAARGKGAYGALYRHVQALVKQNPTQYRGLRLYVDKTNQAAQQVYEKLGMNGEHYQLFEWMV
jgi:ribosomal protein S18 acetylase RimI-like enzyme